MKLAIAVTYSTHTGQFHVYQEQQVDQLIQQLCQADRIVGHINRVIQYCQQDVEILVRLHDYGRRNGHGCYLVS
ncbi:MAG: hypothetical protein C4337_09585 [Armatimonadota bacterium]